MGGAACADCTYGKYAPQALRDDCLECEAGQHTNGAGSAATTCSSCDAGRYSLGLAIACDACTAGQFSRAREGSCTECSPGFFAPDAGASSCSPPQSHVFDEERQR